MRIRPRDIIQVITDHPSTHVFEITNINRTIGIFDYKELSGGMVNNSIILLETNGYSNSCEIKKIRSIEDTKLGKVIYR